MRMYVSPEQVLTFVCHSYNNYSRSLLILYGRQSCLLMPVVYVLH